MSVNQCGQQLNLSQVSNKGASSVDKEKLKKLEMQVACSPTKTPQSKQNLSNGL